MPGTEVGAGDTPVNLPYVNGVYDLVRHLRCRDWDAGSPTITSQ